MKGLIVSIPLWGDAHIERFFNYGLPSLLAFGNLPTLALAMPVTVLFMTHGVDAPKINDRLPKSLTDRCAVQVEIVAPDLAAFYELLHIEGHSGTILKKLTNQVVNRCVDEDKAICPMAGDLIWANNWGENILAAIHKGKRALMSVGTNFPESFLKFADDNRIMEGVITISSYAMCRTWLLNGCGNAPASVDEDSFVFNPSNLRWPAGNGVLIRAFHLNPSFVYPQRKCVMRNGADHDLVNQVLSSPLQIEFAQDATLHLFGGVDGLGNSAPSTPVPFIEGESKGTPSMVARYMGVATWDWYRDFAWLHCWYHDGNMMDPARRKQAMDESNSFMEAAYAEFKRFGYPPRA